MRVITPTMDFDFCFPVGSNFNALNANQRKAVKLAVKAKIMEIDPDSKRLGWQNLAHVDAADDGHIEDDVVCQKADELVKQLGDGQGGTPVFRVLNADNTTRVMTKLCYKIVGNELICYHCYELFKDDVSVQVTADPGGGAQEVTITIMVCYRWPYPFTALA